MTGYDEVLVEVGHQLARVTPADLGEVPAPELSYLGLDDILESRKQSLRAGGL